MSTIEHTTFYGNFLDCMQPKIIYIGNVCQDGDKNSQSAKRCFCYLSVICKSKIVIISVNNHITDALVLQSVNINKILNKIFKCIY